MTELETDGMKGYVVFCCETTGKWIKINADGQIEFSMDDLRAAATFFWDQIEKHSPDMFSADTREKLKAQQELHDDDIHRKDVEIDALQKTIQVHEVTLYKQEHTLKERAEALDAAERRCEGYAMETKILDGERNRLDQELRHLRAKYDVLMQAVSDAQQILAKI